MPTKKEEWRTPVIKTRKDEERRGKMHDGYAHSPQFSTMKGGANCGIITDYDISAIKTMLTRVPTQESMRLKPKFTVIHNAVGRIFSATLGTACDTKYDT